jgi:peptide/nickel transport system ATP-binding protein
VSEPLLRVRGLSIAAATGQGRRVITAGTDLEVDRGETIAIVGESGSGKSVTARTVMGLLSRRATVSPR